MILDELALKTKKRIEEEKKIISFEKMKNMAEAIKTSEPFVFEKAIAKKEIAFICEVKKASPSKGIIDSIFDYVNIAKKYEMAKADAISVLTEPFYFMGSDEYLKDIRKEVSIPILRKDFTIDPYMIYQAKVIGADAILLICSILSLEELKEYLQIAEKLKLSAIVEAHNETEVKMAIAAKARIIGVNNRDLKTFFVDINNSVSLRKLVDEKILFVAESGIKNREDILKLEENGTNAVLIGETLMRSNDIEKSLMDLRGR